VVAGALKGCQERQALFYRSSRPLFAFSGNSGLPGLIAARAPHLLIV
jgi:hypothetical protein